MPDEDVTYRFAGEAPMAFPYPPIAAELQPGDTFEAPPGIEHPLLEVGTAKGGWEPTMDPEAPTPHDPNPVGHDPVVPSEPPPAAQEEPAGTGDAESPIPPASGPPAPSERTKPKGS